MASASASVPATAPAVLPADASLSAVMESGAAYVYPCKHVQPSNPCQNRPTCIYTPVPILPAMPYPDIGHLAKWSVSSFKFGFGPECLRDDDPETFWQYAIHLSLCMSVCSLNSSSDGPQPHFITIEFPRKVAIQVGRLEASVFDTKHEIESTETEHTSHVLPR